MPCIRLILFRNGSKADPVLFTGCIVPKTLQELCHFYTVTSRSKDAFQRHRVFTQDGYEIKTTHFVQNNDVLYLSNGEDFIDPNANSDWIKLNVGGTCFTVSVSTLTTKEPASMLARMFTDKNFTPSARDHTGAYLIDRSPTYFEPILNYLRSNQLIYDKNVNPEGILEEARFFRVESIIPMLEQIASKDKLPRDARPLTRRDVVDVLIGNTVGAELRFQGVNLAGADLSRLDLRNINFKYANLSGCNLQMANLGNCCLERADLSQATLDGAQLLGVKSLCANMEGAQLKNCNFKDPSGLRANMEGVNLKGANLEGSDMGGVNLRVATLKNAMLKNCDLRAAVLAGANLENCDLSGSDLQEANLRGANFKNAAFDLMLTPLHMSQTIR